MLKMFLWDIQTYKIRPELDLGEERGLQYSLSLRIWLLSRFKQLQKIMKSSEINTTLYI